MRADGSKQPERGHGGLEREDRAPVEELRQHTAERRAERNAERPGERPDRGAAGDRGAKRGEHRQRSGEQQRSTDTLHRSGRDQKRKAVRERAGRRGEQENDEPAGEHGARPQVVHEDDQRERHNGDGRVVRGHHPGHAVDRRVQLAVELGQGEDDDRRVGERDRDGGGDQRGECAALHDAIILHAATRLAGLVEFDRDTTVGGSAAAEPSRLF